MKEPGNIVLMIGSGVDRQAKRRADRRRVFAGCLAASLLAHGAVLVAWPPAAPAPAPPAAVPMEVALRPPAPATEETPQHMLREPAAAPRPSRPAVTPARPRPEAARPLRRPEPPRLAASAVPLVSETSIASPDDPDGEGVAVSPEAPPVSAGGQAPRAPAPQPGTGPAITAAAYLESPAPRYPPAARRAGEEGTVTLRVRVDRSGAPANIVVETSSGSSRLDAAAEEAVRQWRFRPARRAAEPVESWVRVPVVFRLEERS